MKTTPSVDPTPDALALVIDDDPSVLAVTHRMLDRCGFTTTSAIAGAQGIEAAGKMGAALTVVVLDLTLPDKPGEEVFDAIRELYPEVPILISSGFPKSRIEARFQGRDVAAYLLKPYRFNTFQRVLEEALSK